ncbi:enoyl-CoA delta isomerase 1, mitochondrial-like [Schistocerca gregaria]|uniref:enoyl-CoA delta isomerase 1, mitochondrial-like n=1 Tax=Schistocerca gregaria TaxID=7010 RepID=UPI00211E93AD|nr:enoyl-CoA delta isomerase 1, mitochondrial-like [Schistocerca gregaria]XP_049860176.1 enoyl-CoA delta isomerase 1, mitochondrial-like [Schistocerca gregaria]
MKMVSPRSLLQLRSLCRSQSSGKFLAPAESVSSGRREYSSKESLVSVAVNDKTGVATVTMGRPPVNGLNLELIQELTSTLESLEKNKSRGMILTSAFPTVFSAGLDIMEMYRPKADRVRAFWTALQDMWLKLYSTPYPTVAAINGHSPAGGCLLSVSCEYRVMVGPKFTIGLNETQLGIVAPTWFQLSFRNVVKHRDAEMALTLGKMFTTEEALKIGLIDEVASDAKDAIGKAEKFIGQFAKISPVARSMTKVQYRAETINWLVKNKESDLNQFLTFVNDPKVQKGLELYLESLKKK